jgi:hypothetical protein
MENDTQKGIRRVLKVCQFRNLSPSLARNLISINKMSDVGVHIIFKKDSCKMVQGEMVLMRGYWKRTLNKLSRSVNSTGCNNTVVPETELIVPHLID